MPPMGRTPVAGQKAKNVKGSLLKLLKYSKKFLPAIIVALLLAIASTVFSIIGPEKVGDISTLISKGLGVGAVDMEEIFRIAIFLVIIYSVGAVFGYAQSFIMTTVTQKITHGLRKDISVKINKLPLRYYDSNTFGDILSRVTNDVDMIGQTLNQSLISLITNVAMIIGVLIKMFTINAIMAATVIGATLLGFLAMMIIMSKSQKHFLAQQVNLGRANGHIEEIYSGHNVVKVLGGEKQAKQTFKEINGRLFTSSWKSQFLSGLMMPIMNFVGNFGFVAVCVVGGALAIKGKIDFGVITSFMIYVRLFSNPLGQIAQAATSMQSTAAASERIFEFLSESELTPDVTTAYLCTSEEDGTQERSRTAAASENLVEAIGEDASEYHESPLVRGEVEFNHVNFGYNPDRTIIHDFSAHVSPGQKVAIVGPTGAGKTTMVNLLMRFYEVSGGSITIDGIDIRDLSRENIHDLFGMVLQDTWLFEGTVFENIAYSKKGATLEQVAEAAKAAGLHHFVRTLPNGYDTVLDDKTTISAGQKQLITIARAMVENAPMLILDEATSSVDTRTEALIQEAMDKLTKGRTSFVIAHRLSTIKNADLILVMRDGDVIESGNHEQLLNKGGFYADLYNSQFATE